MSALNIVGVALSGRLGRFSKDVRLSVGTGYPATVMVCQMNLVRIVAQLFDWEIVFLIEQISLGIHKFVL